VTDAPARQIPAEGHAARPLRVLILMSRTGGGHIASARALEAEFHVRRPDSRITIVDLLTDHVAFPFSRMPATYDSVVNHTPRLWHAMWRLTAIAPVGRSSAAVVRRLSRARIEALLRTSAPDLVISVHPLDSALQSCPAGRRLLANQL